MISSGSEKQLRLELSENGKTQRDAMLHDLQLQMRSIHAKRKRRRRMFAMASFVLVGLVVLSQSNFWNADQNDIHVTKSMNDGSIDVAAGTERSNEHTMVVRNRPGVLERYVVDNANLAVDVVIDPITDDELIDWMQLAGKPAFLGRIDGYLRVIEY